MSAADYRREIGFTFGTFVGVLTFSFGVGFLILAMSVGVRREAGGYLPPGARTALVYGGLALVVVGILVRLYRSRLGVSKYVGTAVFGVGSLAFMFGIARQTTVSAPFVTSPTQKVVLFGIAVVMVIVGMVLVRASARLVGW